MQVDELKQEFDDYWSKVEPFLLCSSETKKRLREDAYFSVEQYFAESHDLYESVEGFLGEPTGFATMLQDSLDWTEKDAARHRRYWRPRIIAAGIALLLIVSAIIVYLSQNPLVYTAHEQTAIHPSEEISDEKLPPKDKDGTYVFNMNTKEWELYDESGHT